MTDDEWLEQRRAHLEARRTPDRRFNRPPTATRVRRYVRRLDALTERQRQLIREGVA